MNITKSQNISRPFTGFFKLKPTKPRYNKIWNTEPVLEKLAELYPLDTLSLEQVTNKLVILLSIGTAHRVQTLSLIEIDKIKTFRTGIDITIDKPIKTTRPGSA